MDGSLLANFPKWLSIPIIILGLLITAWPKLFQVIRETSLWNRSYELEKKRLELLKLRYEIEAIKKTNELGDITAVPNEADQVPTPPTPSPVSPMLFRQRFFYGALGTIPPIFISLLVSDLSHTFSIITPMLILGYSLRIILLLSISGFSSAVGLRKQATPLMCFLVGLTATSLISVLMASSTQITPSTGPIG